MNVIIDGNNLAHRCKWGFSLANHGVDVSVTFGFLKVLSSLLKQFDAKSCIVCWDNGIPEFRRITLPEYKATRSSSMEFAEYEDFNRQMRELEVILPSFGVISVSKPACEADDLMHHASRMCVGNNVIVSMDKDMLQSVTRTVKVYAPTKNKLYTPYLVKKEFEIDVEHYVEWRAIQGDSSDNIQGVKGIGPKTATKLFDRWKTLRGIINACYGRNYGDNEKSKIAEKLVAFGEDNIYRNIHMMDLSVDMAGAKLIIYNSVFEYKRAERAEMRAYLMANAFVSLLDPEFLKSMLKLRKPSIMDNVKVPIICDRRYPLEV